MSDPTETGVEAPPRAAVERALAELDARDEELRGFAARLLRTPSPNPPNDTRAVADLVAAELARLGITDARIVGPDELNANLLVEAAGSAPGRSLILSGHLDTKPSGPLEDWEHGPWQGVSSDGQLHGLGASDMKGAIAAMVYAAAAFRASGAPGSIRLVLTADEETGGVAGASWLARQGLVQGDAAIIGEPSGVHSDWDHIRIVSRGVCLVRFHVEGDQVHSSLSDQIDAVNASVMMAQLMSRLDRDRLEVFRHRPHPLGGTRPTVNVGLDVTAGVGAGFLAGSASFLCDIRLLPSMERSEVEEDLQRFLDEARADMPGLRARYAIELWLDGCEVAPTAAVVGAIQRASERVLGQAPPLGVFPGGTDAPFFHATGIDTVPGFGPGLLSLAHRPGEWVSERSLAEAARLYVTTALEFTAAPAARVAAPS